MTDQPIDLGAAQDEDEPAATGDGERDRADRRPTDEPDGTSAYEASLRQPGSSVSPGADADGADTGVDFDADTDDETGTGTGGAAGYDVDAVSGDTDAYRPQ